MDAAEGLIGGMSMKQIQRLTAYPQLGHYQHLMACADKAWSARYLMLSTLAASRYNPENCRFPGERRGLARNWYPGGKLANRRTIIFLVNILMEIWSTHVGEGGNPPMAVVYTGTTNHAYERAFGESQTEKNILL